MFFFFAGKCRQKTKRFSFSKIQIRYSKMNIRRAYPMYTIYPYTMLSFYKVVNKNTVADYQIIIQYFSALICRSVFFFLTTLIYFGNIVEMGGRMVGTNCVTFAKICLNN